MPQKEIIRAHDEICPACGTYTADGSVCIMCLKAVGLFKPKVAYSEGGTEEFVDTAEFAKSDFKLLGIDLAMGTDFTYQPVNKNN